MSAIAPDPLIELAEPHRKNRFQRVISSRWTFVVLQLLDLATTMAAFRAGGYEMNPMVASLTTRFGEFRGVLMSKVIAIAIAMGVRRLVWVINLFYFGVVLWNMAILFLFSLKTLAR